MWTFLEVYLEEKILHDDENYRIVDTFHSRERKRRGNNEGSLITDKHIMSLLKIAIPVIEKEHIDGNIPENGKVWLYRPQHRLNVVIQYINGSPSIIKILTVMRHHDFHPSKDTTKKIVI